MTNSGRAEAAAEEKARLNLLSINLYLKRFGQSLFLHFIFKLFAEPLEPVVDPFAYKRIALAYFPVTVND